MSEQIDGRKNGLTWGDSPQITEAGLNFYRNKKKQDGTTPPFKTIEPAIVSDIDQQLYGTDMMGYSGAPARAPLAAKFLIPPFSVLNAREGIWQDRKRAWLALGIQSEVGRGPTAGDGLTMSDTIQRLKPSADQTLKNAQKGHAIPGGGTGKNPAFMFKGPDGYKSLKERGEITEAGLAFGEFGEEFGQRAASGTSIFDPVLCELFYRWFTAPGAQIVDPFAGGSVRGVVASLLDRKYWGCDLRNEQVDANNAQADLLCSAEYPRPEWACGDSAMEVSFAPDADAIFSCPPYSDLEVYSDLPEDLSAMAWPDFLTAYRGIISTSCERLKEDRFACFVVGDLRDTKTGFYRNFVSETVRAFLDCGLKLYNEMILVTSVGSLPVRITKQFDSGKKCGKSHQNVLVFCKGDWKRAANYCAGKENTLK